MFGHLVTSPYLPTKIKKDSYSGRQKKQRKRERERERDKETGRRQVRSMGNVLRE